MRHDIQIPVLRQRSPETTAHPLRLGTPPPAPVRSLYIHVPFCFHKCHYCDFYSIVDRQDRQEAFVDRLVRELTALAPLGAAPLASIFVGGGTPTLLRPDLWTTLLHHLDRLFDLGAIRAGHAEFTVECNPETATRELMDTLRAGGVNRLSIGAQSFDPRHLKTLERWHDPANVARALELGAASGIARTSVDLIFAIPGQSAADWERDLRHAIDLGVDHMSCYNLTYEPNTAMTARLARGDFEPVDEDTEFEMYTTTVDTLRARGLDRYEVSNFARPGQECRHNLAYWRQDQWLAAGPSASAHVGGHRWKNTPRLDTYLNATPHAEQGLPPITDHEPPDRRRNLAERLMTGARLREGLPDDEIAPLAHTVDPGAADRLASALRGAADAGWLVLREGRWRPTETGFLFADRMAADLMAALEAG